MSTLLEQASLVMIPSGYKEDIVYSQIPTSGAGDLSFTRASNGTRVNSAGLVEVTPWNLATYSEEFDNAAWVKTTDGQVTITANATTAPNGTTTADKMIASAIAGFHCVAQTQSLVAGVFTISIYAKASEYSFLQIFDSLTTDFANFNLTTGAVATVDQYTATIENVGNGWYRCTATKTNPSGNFVFRYGIVTTGTATRGESFTGNGVNGLFIWGAQLNIGSTAKPYFPTTDRLNVPRLTYQNKGGGCPSLLLEKQSTNVFSYSEQFDNAYWDKNNVSITANSLLSPDGTQNADTMTSTGTTSFLYRSTSSLTGAHTISFFAKKGTSDFCWVYMNGYDAIFNLNTGVYVTSANAVPDSYSIIAMGNGWYRVSITKTSPAIDSVSGIGVASSTNFNGVVGTNVYIYGAQLEASSYPTSYIPTTSSSATRVADACSKTGISSLIGQTEGVVFLDWIMLRESLGVTEDYYTITLNNGTGNTLFAINNYDNRVRFYYYISGSLIFSNTSFEATSGQRLKMAFAYKQNDFAVYINGNQIATSSSGNVAGMSHLTIGCYVFENYNDNIQVNQAALFKTRLSNSELASLTTI